jgi:hypothetical protein
VKEVLLLASSIKEAKMTSIGHILHKKVLNVEIRIEEFLLFI